MLTIPQSDILTILEDFKCLRHSHIRSCIAAKHNSSEEHMDKMLKQLRIMGKIREDGDYVMLPGRKMDGEVIKAFDVLMELTAGQIESISRGAKPFTLMFSVKSKGDPPKSNFFGVINAAPYSENRINEYLLSVGREITVIFILQDVSQQKLLTASGKHYFAVKDQSGKYRFLKTANQP